MKSNNSALWLHLVAGFMGAIGCLYWLLSYWNDTESAIVLVYIFLAFFWFVRLVQSVLDVCFPPQAQKKSVRHSRCFYQASCWTLYTIAGLFTAGLFLLGHVFLDSPEKVMTLTRSDVLALWLLLFSLAEFLLMSYSLYFMRRPKKSGERKSPKFLPRSQYDIPWERRTDSKFRLP